MSGCRRVAPCERSAVRHHVNHPLQCTPSVNGVGWIAGCWVLHACKWSISSGGVISDECGHERMAADSFFMTLVRIRRSNTCRHVRTAADQVHTRV
jgi:hypothetical protein